MIKMLLTQMLQLFVIKKWTDEINVSQLNNK